MTAVEGSSTWHLALVGNPNSGKTALFNALTGSRQKVANYAGVTVERKGRLRQTPAGRSVDLLDLPGTYSLRAPQPGRGGHPRRRAGPVGRRADARRGGVRGRRHQPAAGAAPDPGAEARRPADGAGAQHVRHRPAAGPADRSRAALGGAGRARRHHRGGPQAAASRTCCARSTRWSPPARLRQATTHGTSPSAERAARGPARGPAHPEAPQSPARAARHPDRQARRGPAASRRRPGRSCWRSCS